MPAKIQPPSGNIIHHQYGAHCSVNYQRCAFVVYPIGPTGSLPDQNSLHHPINDGLLYGAEIARMDMRNCDLVTLAACNTATGIVTQNGILGLQTAFKEAGVRSILMTLWSVNDKATAEFMKLFYTYLFAGNSKHESLELARKDFMNSPDYNHPLYWAPFILLD
ncbi:MAG: CHAT domain-containing protein [Bacteroidales bacterium]|nr:CHAT domain-containing protein [Bacteroidales bacterium]